MVRHRRCCCWVAVCVASIALTTTAALAQDKLLPPLGIELDASVRTELQARIDAIDRDSELLASSTEDWKRWRPDVDVLTRAVSLALAQSLFYKPADAKNASDLLDEAERRLRAVIAGKRGLELLQSKAPESDKPSLVVGGFRSRIDDSVQPFGLVIPIGYQADSEVLNRMDVWLHGRGDDKVELAFLKERMSKVGEYAPVKTFVLHPFGRHCNAFKFAGETDVYEAIEHAKSLLSIDPDKIAMRGFSMGGAGCWHLGAHDPGAWFAVNPGAGFVDTLIYQGWDKNPPFAMSEAQTRLLHWYDVIPWVGNFKNTNLVAYSGEVDNQRQAAELVLAETVRLDVPMQHVIGAKMGHKIDAVSAVTIEQRLNAIAKDIAAPPRKPRAEIDFVTYTLRYSKVDWLQVTGLERHWDRAHVEAKIEYDRITIKTEGITSLEFDFGDRWETPRIELTIDSDILRLKDESDDIGFQARLVRDGKHWIPASDEEVGLRKRPGLQGPIDDAFCDRFLFVVPSRPAAHGAAQRWIDRELKYAQQRWSRLMRGEIRVVQDTLVTPEQIANCNLICFGDFTSNRYLAGIANRLPIRWDREHLDVGSRSFDPSTHVAAFCYPNPANPDRYVVVNSGMTFRDFSNTSNSRQIAMLPDWAIFNVESTDHSIFAGDIAEEGFFDEQWQLGKELAVDSRQSTGEEEGNDPESSR